MIGGYRQKYNRHDAGFYRIAGRQQVPTSVTLHALEATLHPLDDLIKGEARRPLARWIFLEGREEFCHEQLRGENDGAGASYDPVAVTVRSDIGTLKGIRPQVEHLLQPQFREWFGPDAHGAGRALLGEYYLPVLVSH